MTPKPVKTVAILGFGPCGAGAARAFVEEGGYDITIFEKRPQSGGLWNYTAQDDADLIPIPCEQHSIDAKAKWDQETNQYFYASPVYDALDTNIPKDIMNYAGVPFPEHLPLFPHRKDVLKYIQKYSQPYEKYVKFNRKVVSVERNDSDTKWVVRSRLTNVKQTEGGNKESQDDQFKDQYEEFDAVVVAIGNYETPFIPHRDGVEDWLAKYPGSIDSVKSYRTPFQYKDLKGKILIVGNSASANDLCFQISQALNINVWKSKRSENNMPAGTSDKIIEVPDIKRFDAATGSVEFIDGSKLENVAKIIFATGYLRSFPFFQKINASDKPLLTDGKKVHGLYKHMILYNYPNLAVVGLARYFLPTRSAEIQSSWIAKFWNGKIPNPSYQEMQNWENERIAATGNNSTFHDLLFPHDVHYNNELNKDILKVNTGLIPFIWNKEQISIRGSIKNIKEAYIKYKAETGKVAYSYHELVENGYLNRYLMSNEELIKNGFEDFIEE